MTVKEIQKDLQLYYFKVKLTSTPFQIENSLRLFRNFIMNILFSFLYNINIDISVTYPDDGKKSPRSGEINT